MRRKIKGYREAIEWIVTEDDVEWLDDGRDSPSVTACMVADLYDRHIDEVVRDLRRALARA